MIRSLPVSGSNKFWARIFLQYDNGGHVSKMLQHVPAAETLVSKSVASVSQVPTSVILRMIGVYFRMVN